MSSDQLDVWMYGSAVLAFVPMAVAALWNVFIVFVVIKALLTFIAMRRIAEENLELNRQRTTHAEKTAAMLVAIRDRLERGENQ